MTTTRTSRRAALLVSGTVLLTALATSPAQAADLPVVTAARETAALHDDVASGNADADDPAIWRNAADPGRSLVVATAKEGGLRVYDLDARLVQSLPAPRPPAEDDAPGRFNNVDLVSGLRTPSGPADVAVVSDRGNDRLRVYRIDPSRPGGPLTDISDPAAAPVFSADQAEMNGQRTRTAWPPGRTGPPAAATPWSAGANAPASPCSNSSPPPAARSATAPSAPSTCPPPSACPTARPGAPAPSPANTRRSRA